MKSLAREGDSEEGAMAVAVSARTPSATGPAPARSPPSMLVSMPQTLRPATDSPYAAGPPSQAHGSE
ncbi:hypothetical protein SHKM778_65020 [Streptomyces sp. KM77-8]|uniref:Uncharacterized protein n=1 Tax=Streptomyces haneummycinicus TaxID=3074435 RepID=A0AAT9HR67_9ACTN